MKITIKDVEYVAKLARLSLDEKEKVEYCEQLDKILEYMDELEQVDTTDIKPMSHPVEMKNVFREDEVNASSLADDIISNAPEKEARFFKVKKVIE